MILFDLLKFVELNSGITKKDLADHFEVSEDGIDAMILIWMQKGLLKTVRSRNGEMKYFHLKNNEISVNILG
ncbi:hypothetical protein CS022_00510 [Veronia nyctiphanis]|uniref:Transcriptional regulator HTH-type FeoC domain-containing protein n=1 Tax=Veronia nyctiphanis TaxID=1278244 RepID=A0A4Q0YU27_9GAMM|nr:FeoC-like transcriptional regulator [Veronia nyctiphanis]RXJ74750.1 hypothetical protein CS022_00510 [Veronia nyctiphanis]